jgi:ribosomal protein S21
MIDAKMRRVEPVGKGLRRLKTLLDREQTLAQFQQHSWLKKPSVRRRQDALCGQRQTAPGGELRSQNNLPLAAIARAQARLNDLSAMPLSVSRYMNKLNPVRCH